MSSRIGQYKQGSYGTGSNKRKQMVRDAYASQSLRNQALIIAKRPSGAPLANRGFKPITPLNKERKYFDTPSQTWVCNTDSTFVLLNVPQRGADYNQRIGRKITVRSIYARGSVYIQPAENAELQAAVNVISKPQVVRMIIFIDAQPNGVAPVRADVLTEAEPSSQLNPNNRDRFKIIKDKLFAFDPYYLTNAVAAPGAGVLAANMSFGRTIYTVKAYKKTNIETIYNENNNGTIGDINTNALYVMFIGSHANAATLEAKAHLSFRLRFDDS